MVRRGGAGFTEPVKEFAVGERDAAVAQGRPDSGDGPAVPEHGGEAAQIGGIDTGRPFAEHTVPLGRGHQAQFADPPAGRIGELLQHISQVAGEHVGGRGIVAAGVGDQPHLERAVRGRGELETQRCAIRTGRPCLIGVAEPGESVRLIDHCPRDRTAELRAGTDGPLRCAKRGRGRRASAIQQVGQARIACGTGPQQPRLPAVLAGSGRRRNGLPGRRFHDDEIAVYSEGVQHSGDGGLIQREFRGTTGFCCRAEPTAQVGRDREGNSVRSGRPG
nr:hypothetical protein [Nocardia cyriacigeorgica]